MKRTILTCILGLMCICAIGQEKKAIKGFSGGMMIHTGYQFGGDNPYNFTPKGATFGMGGVARLHLSKHMRTGFEGYFSKIGLGHELAKGSYNKLFWAGALIDCYWEKGRFYPYLGVTVGGGMETAFYMFDGNSNDWIREENVVLNKEPFFALDPFVGCDIALGSALRLTVKMDWLNAFNKNGLNRPLGPRLYLGFIFAH